jgi:predicted nucleic acid-binding protein
MALLSSVGQRVYLDTNVFVYAVEGYPQFAQEIRALFRAIDQGQVKAVTSELTLAEVLVKPLADGNDELCRLYENTLWTSRGLSVLPVTRAILRSAAQLRASANVRLPDAIHLATASAVGCNSFLTNDNQLQSHTALKVVVISAVV